MNDPKEAAEKLLELLNGWQPGEDVDRDDLIALYAKRVAEFTLFALALDEGEPRQNAW